MKLLLSINDTDIEFKTCYNNVNARRHSSMNFDIDTMKIVFVLMKHVQLYNDTASLYLCQAFFSVYMKNK